jgi:oxygen-independent coproporphyrinogen-3 oxidase
VDQILAAADRDLRRFGVEQVPTVYIGGGTPSVLGARETGRLLRGLRSFGALAKVPPGEITLEVNPESAGEELLRAAREGGVSRISAGVQSFHEASRRAIGRAGESRRLPARLRLMAEIFPRAFSADLIAGLPGQDEGVLRRDIDRLLAFEPAHVSLYALTLAEGSPLAARARRPGFLPPPEEAERLWIAGRDALTAAGYAHYEVSNFALPGHECRHNLRYWRMENWLGIGPAASGTLIDDETGSGRRYTGADRAEDWLREGPPPEPAEEYLDPLTLMKESLLMGFRSVEGPEEALFARRFRRTIPQAIPRTIAAWKARGFFAGDRLAPSPEGLLFLDPFLRDAFGELDRAPDTAPSGRRAGELLNRAEPGL